MTQRAAQHARDPASTVVRLFASSRGKNLKKLPRRSSARKIPSRVEPSRRSRRHHVLQTDTEKISGDEEGSARSSSPPPSSVSVRSRTELDARPHDFNVVLPHLHHAYCGIHDGATAADSTRTCLRSRSTRTRSNAPRSFAPRSDPSVFPSTRSPQLREPRRSPPPIFALPRRLASTPSPSQSRQRRLRNVSARPRSSSSTWCVKVCVCVFDVAIF